MRRFCSKTLISLKCGANVHSQNKIYIVHEKGLTIQKNIPVSIWSQVFVNIFKNTAIRLMKFNSSFLEATEEKYMLNYIEL
jgi:hypothetical protein